MRRTNLDINLAVSGLLTLVLTGTAFAGAITGEVSFWGDSDGAHPIDVAAHSALGAPPEHSTVISSPGGAYNLPVADGSYYISAFLDRDESGGPPDPGEPVSWYDPDGDGRPDKVAVAGGTAVMVDIDLGFIYVDIDAEGAGNGSSWANAFTALNAGIQAASSGIEVWVAEGTYTPGNTRSSRFALKNGVGVYGGFSGNEKTLLERNPATHLTTLSGEIGVAGTADNVYNVVWANGTLETALIDGVTITGGRADGAIPFDMGGGLYAYHGVATAVNVTFTGNYASNAGGGAATNAGVVHIYNSRFFGNQAGVYPSGLGGGFYGNTYGEKLVNCVFSGNQAGQRGGAIYMGSGIFGGTLAGLSVYGNTTGWEAGGLFINNTGASHTYLSNSIIWGNKAHQILTWGTVQVSDSLVQGGGVNGTNIVDGDPQFADADGADNVAGTTDDDLRLKRSSPAIDAGNNETVPADAADLDGDLDIMEAIPLDMDFITRFADVPDVVDTGIGTAPIVDFGAYEVFLGPVIFKDGFE